LKRCSSCILLETYPGIRFNEQGLCTYCASHQRKEYYGEEALKRIIERQRAKHQPFDAVVGISGGRDSAYALYYMVRVAKLKVLGFLFDNGLVPESARANLKNMTESLGVELVVGRNCLRECLKNNLEAWIRKPCLNFILLTCTICNAGIEIGLRQAAKQRGVSLIVTGSGGVEEAHFKGALVHFGARRQERNHLALTGAIVWELLRNPAYFKHPRCLYEEGRAFLYQYLPWPVMQRLFYRDQTRIDLFNYIPFDEPEIHRVIETELGWRKPANVESPWRFDCKLSFLKNWIFLQLFDFSEKDDLFSSMIREGLLTREEALRRIDRENLIPEELVRDLCREAGLDLEKIRKATHQLRTELEHHRREESLY